MSRTWEVITHTLRASVDDKDIDIHQSLVSLCHDENYLDHFGVYTRGRTK